ncbi:pilus assembly protein PilP [Trichlorobacter ammonificans]|uniref:Type IV pilus assembly protein PilP n=1 Tax=Trichlorobacter ammonificans TaxID=2916410 RepID=A0ABN8HHX8_9BACT|nr:pilus assembly protein PilP [Trichlorobacter ammonificans]CAH2030789.1 Type IV pilus assembly protein PilP [Trichlorobacter ammonificans]
MTRPSPKNKRLVAGVLVLASGLLLGAGGTGKTVTVQKTAGPAASAPPVAALPMVTVPIQKQTSSLRYMPAQHMQFDFSKKKDPFKPFLVVKPEAVAGSVKRVEKPLLPIHSFTLEQFRLIGVVADPKGNRAMVVDPSGKGYVLKVGMTIGRDEARITRIDTSGVEAVRQYRDEKGKAHKETARIPLQRNP